MHDVVSLTLPMHLPTELISVEERDGRLFFSTFGGENALVDPGSMPLGLGLWLTGCKRAMDEYKEAKAVFASFDKDGDGFLSASDIKLTLEQAYDFEGGLTRPVTDSDIDAAAMIHEADTNGDGLIDLEELATMRMDPRSLPIEGVHPGAYPTWQRISPASFCRFHLLL